MWRWVSPEKYHVQSHTSLEKREKKRTMVFATDILMRINTILAEEETFWGDNIHIEWEELGIYLLCTVRGRRGNTEDYSKLNMSNIGNVSKYVLK